MSVDPVGLLDHRLRFEDLAALPSRMADAFPGQWTWDREPSRPRHPRIWGEEGVLSLHGPKVSLDLTRHTALLFIAYDFRYLESQPELLRSTREGVREVGRILNASQVVFVPDNASKSMIAVSWLYEGWRLEDIVVALSREFGVPRSDFMELIFVRPDGIYEVRDSYSLEVLGPSAEPPPRDWHPIMARDGVLKSFSLESLEFMPNQQNWTDLKLMVMKELLPGVPTPVNSTWYGMHLVLLGTEATRLRHVQHTPTCTRTAFFQTRSRWLARMRGHAHPRLRHYKFHAMSHRFEALAFDHVVDFSFPDDPGGGGTITKYPRRPDLGRVQRPERPVQGMSATTRCCQVDFEQTDRENRIIGDLGPTPSHPPPGTIGAGRPDGANAGPSQRATRRRRHA